MNAGPEVHCNRDIRVSAGGLRLRPPRLVAALATAFAESIFRRYGFARAWRHRVESHFLRATVTPSTFVTQSFSQLAIAPSVTLSLVSHVQQLVPPRSAGSRLLSPRVGDMTRHATLWGSRIESVRSPHSTGSGRRSAADVSFVKYAPGSTPTIAKAVSEVTAPPIPRVVRRAMAQASEAQEMVQGFPGPRPRLEPRRSGVPGSVATAIGPEPGDMSVAQVNRLTDRVIQAIDRRIVAERERLGRI